MTMGEMVSNMNNLITSRLSEPKIISGSIEITTTDDVKITTGFKPTCICLVNQQAVASDSNNLAYAIVSVYNELISPTKLWQNLKYASNSYHQLIDMNSASTSGMVSFIPQLLDDGFIISLYNLSKACNYVSSFYGTFYYFVGTYEIIQ